MSFRIAKPLIYSLISAQIAGCMVGPDYVRPEVKNLSEAKEFKEVKGWKQAQPRDNVLSGKWWEIFNDPDLSKLESQVATANQSIIQAEAQFRQAEHLVLTAESALLPSATMNGSAQRFVAPSGGNFAPVGGVRNTFSNSISGSWQLDLWGSVRRQIEANVDNAQASAATMQALILSSQSTLALNYFQLKILDEQKKLMEETVAAFNKTLEITKNRYAAGIVAKSDVVQAEAQLESTRAQVINLGVQRAKFEHAIAVLVGKAPGQLTLPYAEFSTKLPSVPVSLPSELLERRPDIAAAERQAAAANASVGVAKAAYFPTVNLSANDGFQGSLLDTLYTAARNYWTLGPASAALVIFDGGAKNAQYKQRIDAFDASVANYRQKVLTAIQEVEDNLAALRILEEQSDVQNKALAAANEALALTINQYQAGTVSYINVMTAQTNALNNRVETVKLQGSRLGASVQLITALGGGWDLNRVPNSEQIGGEIKWTDYMNIPGVDQGKSENTVSTSLSDLLQFHILP
ncbi:MAG: efflux transporter outer membrane subunit [Methylococcales bacterium]